MKTLSKYVLPIWIEGTEEHTEELVKRFTKAPKPMYYSENFLIQCWNNFLKEKNIPETQVDPNEFIVWGYRKLLENRLPRYRKIAENWGIILKATDVAKVKSADNFTSLISANLKGQKMPIRIPSKLPAFEILKSEGVNVMSNADADRQDIRPLKIGLLNLMPLKIQTENQFSRLIG